MLNEEINRIINNPEPEPNFSTITLSQLNDVIRFVGSPAMKFNLMALKANIPNFQLADGETMHDKITIDVEALHRLCLLSGLKEVTLENREAKEDIKFNMGSIGGRGTGGVATGASVAKEELRPELLPPDAQRLLYDLLTGEYSALQTSTWGLALIPIDFQEMQKKVQAKYNNLRSVEGWKNEINSALVEGIAQASIQHLLHPTAENVKAFVLIEALAQSLVVLSNVANILQHHPVTPESVLLPEFLMHLTSSIFTFLGSRRNRPTRFSEFGTLGPEVIRSGVMKFLAISANYSQIPEKFKILK